MNQLNSKERTKGGFKTCLTPECKVIDIIKFMVIQFSNTIKFIVIKYSNTIKFRLINVTLVCRITIF